MSKSKSLREIKGRIRKAFTIDYLKAFGELTTLIIQSQPDGTHAPLGCFVENGWKVKIGRPLTAYVTETPLLRDRLKTVDYALGLPVEFADNPLLQFCLTFRRVKAFHGVMNGHNIMMVIHGYTDKEGAEVFNTIAVCFDQNLRQIICDENLQPEQLAN